MFVNPPDICFCGYGLDITEIKAAENEKTKLINELSHKNNDLMQFNYIVSHNLRGPISSLIGLSDLITLPSVSDEEKKKIIENIGISALKMDVLLKDLSILLSKSSTLNSQKEDIDIKKLILNITDALKDEILQSKTVIHFEIAEQATTIYSIKNYIESILYNLITNAIKYKSAERAPEIYIETKKENGQLILKIKDNGIGINIAMHGKHMFGLYKRFNLDTEGKGLGLHMTKTQVEALGGQISIESEVDKGTVVTVMLPLK
jgi:signal transduction histidine kinase